MPATIGRPTKLSAARIDALCKSIGQGATYEVAAMAAGIHRTTVTRWKEYGEAVLTTIADKPKTKLTDQDKLAASFCVMVEEAEAEAEVALIEVARNCALGAPAEYDDKGRQVRAEIPPDGRLALEFLGRKHPGRWSKRLHVRDDTPRTPAEADASMIARFDAAFAEAFPEALDGVAAENLMPPVGLNGEHSSNGHRNGSG